MLETLVLNPQLEGGSRFRDVRFTLSSISSSSNSGFFGLKAFRGSTGGSPRKLTKAWRVRTETHLEESGPAVEPGKGTRPGR